jgi:diguanylate cyclase (GGDEF)-like protein
MGPEASTRLPRSAWIAAARLTAIVIFCATVVSVILSTIILDLASNGINGTGLMVAMVMPLILGTPVMFYLAVGRQRLKHANAELSRLAATDWLTDCLNRRAFTQDVEQRLAAIGAAGSRTEGALLMIDADRFKAINDRFGHEEGDAALQLIADAIRSAVRAGDLVGRVGGEEFGVFLENADVETVGRIAEGIRAAIAARVFAPGGQVHPLSASIGGATFAGTARASELFRLADARLYDVKGEQRGRVKLAAA